MNYILESLSIYTDVMVTRVFSSISPVIFITPGSSLKEDNLDSAAGTIRSTYPEEAVTCLRLGSGRKVCKH